MLTSYLIRSFLKKDNFNKPLSTLFFQKINQFFKTASLKRKPESSCFCISSFILSIGEHPTARLTKIKWQKLRQSFESNAFENLYPRKMAEREKVFQ